MSTQIEPKKSSFIRSPLGIFTLVGIILLVIMSILFVGHFGFDMFGIKKGGRTEEEGSKTPERSEEPSKPGGSEEPSKPGSSEEPSEPDSSKHPIEPGDIKNLADQEKYYYGQKKSLISKINDAITGYDFTEFQDRIEDLFQLICTIIPLKIIKDL